jgi:hypothetical protein
MVDLEVDISRVQRRTFSDLETAVERFCNANGLTITMKSTLSKYPGSIHWHLKKGQDRGTLEVTLWPAKERLWFSMQSGRTADWVMETARRLRDQLEAR